MYGKNKLGLNNGWGSNIQGIFTSPNELILNQNEPCEFTLTKNKPAKNQSLNSTETTDISGMIKLAKLANN